MQVDAIELYKWYRIIIKIYIYHTFGIVKNGAHVRPSITCPWFRIEALDVQWRYWLFIGFARLLPTYDSYTLWLFHFFGLRPSKLARAESERGDDPDPFCPV